MKHTVKALTLASLMLPAVAAAHSGHDSALATSPYLDGVIHALTGPDHVVGAILGGACLAMALHKTRKSLANALPVALLVAVAFLASVLLGSLMPAALTNVAEWAVLASLAVMIVAIATGLKQRGQPLALAAVLVAALASCHALAHGGELTQAAPMVVMAFASGACTLLIAIGCVSAYTCNRILARFTFAKL